jgi:hypothetical protein
MVGSESIPSVYMQNNKVEKNQGKITIGLENRGKNTITSFF